MVENNSYQRPFICSLLLHAALLIFLLINLNNYVNYTTADTEDEPVIHAVAVNEKQVESQINKIKSQQRMQQQAEAAAAKAQQQREQQAAQVLAQQQREAAQAKIKELAATVQQPQQTVTPKPNAKPLDQPIQRSAEDLIAADIAKEVTEPVVTEKKPLPTKPAANSKLKQAMERELQKQLAQESTEQEISAEANKVSAAASQANSAHVRGEVDKYKALIVQAISQHWLIPDDTRQDLSCELFIRVAADGDVISVEVARSSGDAVLDRSARAAVFKAAPLPVPKEAEVFDKFRELRLTVRPENVI